MAENIFSIVSYIDQSQKFVSQENIRHLRLYSNLDIRGLSFLSYTQTSGGVEEKLKYNLIASVTDTLSAKISKNKPKPTFLTNGADWSTQRKSKLMDLFCQGLFYKDDTYSKAQQVFVDACVWGTGVLKIYEKDNSPCSERVVCDELKVDLSDAYYGDPRTIYQTKFINREVLLELYPDKEKEIILAEPEKSDKRGFNQDLQLTDQIKVIESWHLPSGSFGEDDKTDGRHTITISNAVLFDEEWRKDYFPFVFFRLMPKMLGFWGKGVAESLLSIQYELNKLLMVLQTSMHLTCIPKVLKDSSSAIVDAHLNNEIGGIIEYSGIKPEYWAGGSIPPELVAQIQFLIQKGYEEFGISQLSAASQKPAGLNAAVALREYNDIETERFVLIGQRWEQFFVQIAKSMIYLTKDIYDREGKFKINVPNRKFLEEISWKEIDLCDSDYLIQIFPTSSLPSKPEGRLQKIQEMVQAGMIPPDQGIKLLDFPDFESYLSLNNADINDIEMVIEKMIESGKYQIPEPYQNLSLGIKMIQSAYLKARIDKVPEERLELLRRWISQANEMLSASSPDMAPTQEMAGPMAQPEPPPISELVPNVPLQ